MDDENEMDWFTFKVDITIGEPQLDEKTGEYHGGRFHSKALPEQEALKALAEDEGSFFLRVDATTDELWLRVCRSDAAPDDTLDDDLVFINIGTRNAERLRDALDAALKLMARST